MGHKNREPPWVELVATSAAARAWIEEHGRHARLINQSLDGKRLIRATDGWQRLFRKHEVILIWTTSKPRP